MERIQSLDIKKVLIVGTGTLGSQIGFQCAIHGFATTMYNPREASLEACKKVHQQLGETIKADLGKSDSEIAVAQENLSYTTDLVEAARDCDLVSESVPEYLEIKRQVFHDLNEICPAHTIFTTDSSTLLPSEIADATGRGERFLALHFANQIWVRNICEVMKHPGTDREVFERVVTFAKAIGMVPILLEKENRGYVLNALLVPLLSAAQSLVVNGIASPMDIDRTWVISTQAPMGPFAILDMIGLETVYNVCLHLAKVAGDEQMQRIADYLKKHYVDKGKFGVKTGEGFYKYPDPAYAQPSFLT